MIEEATVDAYGDSEQATSWATILDDKLALPFETEVLGVSVRVVAVDLGREDAVVAICERARKRLRVHLVDLPMPTPRPHGAEWIEAYRAWLDGTW